MSVVMDELERLIGRLPTTQADPVWLRHLGMRILDEARRRDGGGPVGSQGERGADGLSTDATRNPDLTYGGQP